MPDASDAREEIEAVIDGLRVFDRAPVEEYAQSVGAAHRDKRRTPSLIHELMVEIETLALAREMRLPTTQIQKSKASAFAALRALGEPSQ